MNRFIAEHRKALTVLALGLLQLAAYIAADPRNLPPWVVSAAVAVNTVGVWWVRNAPVESRNGPAMTRLARSSELGDPHHHS